MATIAQAKEMLALVHEFLGTSDEDVVGRWMNTPHQEFMGSPPIDVINLGQIEVLIKYLKRMVN